jgi:hypothetical protein
MDGTVGELIDRLAEESEQGLGFHSTAAAEGFAALDEEPRFVGGILGSQKPVTSPVFQELVRRGLAALPDLLEHLTDSDTTKLSVGHDGFFGAMWHADEYHPRHTDPQKQPPGVNTGREGRLNFEGNEPRGGQYTVRIGDLCYVLVGQIVNRSLNAVRYQPTACLVINSPVENAGLAAAVKADWSGLTAEQHRESLTQDVYSLWPGAAPAAMQRLWFYYPDAGEPLAQRLLARPLAQTRPDAWAFVTTTLLAEKDSSRWRHLIDEFRRQQGQAAAELIPSALGAIVLGQHDEEKVRRPIARRILEDVYPWYNPFEPPFLNAACVGDQAELLTGLHSFASQKIDEAAAEAFRRALELASPEYWDRVEVDDLALACMSHLAGKPHARIFQPWLDERIRLIDSGRASSPEQYRLSQLKEWHVRLFP